MSAIRSSCRSEGPSIRQIKTDDGVVRLFEYRQDAFSVLRESDRFRLRGAVRAQVGGLAQERIRSAFRGITPEKEDPVVGHYGGHGAVCGSVHPARLVGESDGLGQRESLGLRSADLAGDGIFRGG